jgi:hypothetical protein
MERVTECLSHIEDPFKFFDFVEVIVHLICSANTHFQLDEKSLLAEDPDLALWPEIRAMVVNELFEISNRFGSHLTSNLINQSLYHAASYLLATGLSPLR